MKYTKSFIRFIFWKFWLLRAWTRARVLKNDQDESVSIFANVFLNTIRKKLSIEDKIWVNNIESMRKEFKRDYSEVIVTDYGAGSPNLNRTDSQMHIGQVLSTTVSSMNSSSQSPFWSLLLYKIISQFKPKTALELGTNLGISAAYQGAALTIYSSGKLISMEGSASLIEKSRKHFTYLGLINIETVEGRFSDNLSKVLEDHHPIDYVFIDGHHNQDALVNYFNTILPHLSNKSIIIIDDITWSKGMKLAWKKINNDENIKLIFNLNKLGVCFIDKDNKVQQRKIKL